MVGKTYAQADGKEVALIVPTAAEGSTDLLARLIASGLTEQGFGNVRVNNMPGANGALAAGWVANAKADGTTLLISTPSSHGIASAVTRTLPYDPVTGFTPIVRFGTAPYLLVVKAGAASTLAEFAAQVRAGGKTWRYSSTGVGSPHHLVAESYFKQVGWTFEHVPLAGGAAALDQVSRGGVDVMLPAAVLALPRIRSGEFKALAVTGTRRLAALPDVPTFAELGVPVDIVSWYGLMAPAGLNADLAAKLAEAIGSSLATPSAQAKLAEFATTQTAETGEAFARVVAHEVDLWRSLVSQVGIRTNPDQE